MKTEGVQALAARQLIKTKMKTSFLKQTSAPISHPVMLPFQSSLTTFRKMQQNVTGTLETEGNSTEQNPIHTYYTEGNYNVNLTVTNANGTDSKFHNKLY